MISAFQNFSKVENRTHYGKWTILQFVSSKASVLSLGVICSEYNQYSNTGRSKIRINVLCTKYTYIIVYQAKFGVIVVVLQGHIHVYKIPMSQLTTCVNKNLLETG